MDDCLVNNNNHKSHVVIIGAGFTGLAAAYEISRQGIGVTVFEKEDELGGLAGSFKIDGGWLEKFYHHWFNNDKYIIQLAKDMGAEDQVIFRPTMTGVYFDKKIFKLSTPMDVLRFKPLSLLNRIRLGLLVLKARRVKDWKQLESITAGEWLIGLCGEKVYEVVWEPLLRGKFGSSAPEISAVWFWNKLLLRGGSRGNGGKEVLAYYQGGFAALVERIASKIIAAGGVIKTGEPVEALIVLKNAVLLVRALEFDPIVLLGFRPVLTVFIKSDVIDNASHDHAKLQGANHQLGIERAVIRNDLDAIQHGEFLRYVDPVVLLQRILEGIAIRQHKLMYVALMLGPFETLCRRMLPLYGINAHLCT